jgi:hypothetical protein
VKGFPADVTDETVIFNHFSKLGYHVVEAKLARNYHDSLDKFIKITKMKRDVKYQQAVVSA